MKQLRRFPKIVYGQEWSSIQIKQQVKKFFVLRNKKLFYKEAHKKYLNLLKVKIKTYGTRKNTLPTYNWYSIQTRKIFFKSMLKESDSNYKNFIHKQINSNSMEQIYKFPPPKITIQVLNLLFLALSLSSYTTKNTPNALSANFSNINWLNVTTVMVYFYPALITRLQNHRCIPGDLVWAQTTSKNTFLSTPITKFLPKNSHHFWLKKLYYLNGLWLQCLLGKEKLLYNEMETKFNKKFNASYLLKLYTSFLSIYLKADTETKFCILQKWANDYVHNQSTINLFNIQKHAFQNNVNIEPNLFHIFQEKPANSLPFTVAQLASLCLLHTKSLFLIRSLDYFTLNPKLQNMLSLTWWKKQASESDSILENAFIFRKNLFQNFKNTNEFHKYFLADLLINSKPALPKTKFNRLFDNSEYFYSPFYRLLNSFLLRNDVNRLCVVGRNLYQIRRLIDNCMQQLITKNTLSELQHKRIWTFSVVDFVSSFYYKVTTDTIRSNRLNVFETFERKSQKNVKLAESRKLLVKGLLAKTLSSKNDIICLNYAGSLFKNGLDESSNINAKNDKLSNLEISDTDLLNALVNLVMLNQVKLIFTLTPSEVTQLKKKRSQVFQSCEMFNVDTISSKNLKRILMQDKKNYELTSNTKFSPWVFNHIVSRSDKYFAKSESQINSCRQYLFLIANEARLIHLDGLFRALRHYKTTILSQTYVGLKNQLLKIENRKNYFLECKNLLYLKEKILTHYLSLNCHLNQQIYFRLVKTPFISNSKYITRMQKINFTLFQISSNLLWKPLYPIKPILCDRILCYIKDLVPSQLNNIQAINIDLISNMLNQRVSGQTKAVNAVIDVIRRSKLRSPKTTKPLGSFFFAGPTGVGKTELAKALAVSLFGSESSFLRFDMSEFAQPHTTQRLIGPPPGYVGYGKEGDLTGAVKKNPNMIILFDEYEKACPAISDLLLQVLDDGRLTDGKGETVNFQDCFIILTSNIGYNIQNTIKETEAETMSESLYQETVRRVKQAMNEQFRPEFVNRLDSIVVFRNLGKKELRLITKKLLQNLNVKIKEVFPNITIYVEPFAINLIVEAGFRPGFGARPLLRTITRMLETPLIYILARFPLATKADCIFALDPTTGNLKLYFVKVGTYKTYKNSLMGRLQELEIQSRKLKLRQNYK